MASPQNNQRSKRSRYIPSRVAYPSIVLSALMRIARP